MKVIWTVMRKELARVFKDSKLILTVILLPGLLLFTLYSLMGNFMNTTEEILVPFEIHYNQHIDQSFIDDLGEIKTEDGSIIKLIKYEGETEDLKSLIEEGKIQTYLSINDINNTKAISIQYNSDKIQSTYAAMYLESHLKNYVSIADQSYYLSSPISIISDEETVSRIVSSMLPFLIMTFLFQGAMAVGPESIAGDKERGTISTLLATPTKRSNIAIGKIFSLSILSILSAISSFIGVIFSMDALVQNDNAISYKPSEYLIILLIIICTVILIISLIAVLSATAKNIKEASMISMPLMLVSMVVGVMTMSSNTATTNTLSYLIPLYNSAQGLVAAFNQQVNVTNLLLIILSNFVYAIIFGYILTKQFNSEKIMFAK